VDIANLVVDGANSGVDCSTNLLIGIQYNAGFGSLDNVDVRNQNPGGCGYGIIAGGLGDNLEVNIRNSRIHDFDYIGVFAGAVYAEFTLNLASNWIASASTTVQAGVSYGFSSEGRATYNIIEVAGRIGLDAAPYVGGVIIVADNLVIGSNVGMFLGCCGTTVTRNNLFNNGTGIVLYGEGNVIKSNAIVQSSTAAIDADCSSPNTVENNIIFGAPIGIANIASGDTVKGNTFYSVTTLTTTCP